MTTRAKSSYVSIFSCTFSQTQRIAVAVPLGVPALQSTNHSHTCGDTPGLQQGSQQPGCACSDYCLLGAGTGSGDRAFSSGAALKGDGEHFTVHVPPHVIEDYEDRKMIPQPPTIRPPDMVMARQTIAFWDFPKPLIMAINGLAVGGGANIALANYADMVICSRTARFKYPFSTLGITPELGSSSLIPFVVGMAKAKEIMMLGVRLLGSATALPHTVLL